MSFKNFKSNNSIHIVATENLTKLLEVENCKCEPFGYESEPNFKPTKEYRSSIPKEYRYKPDLKVTTPSGETIHIEIKSRGNSPRPDISVELNSVLAGLYYENSYVAAIHLGKQYMFFIKCIDFLPPEKILIGENHPDQIIEYKNMFPESKIVKIINPKGNGNAYMWAEKHKGISLEQLLKEVN